MFRLGAFRLLSRRRYGKRYVEERKQLKRFGKFVSCCVVFWRRWCIVCLRSEIFIMRFVSGKNGTGL
jgi:hypothetical protein